MPEINYAIEELILAGAMEVSGIDQETGQFLYNFTPKLEEMYPGLFKLVIDNVYGHILSLWEKGFLNINMDSDDPMISLTEKGVDASELLKLEDHEFLIMENLIRAFEE
jgi:hypothetical protein